MTTEDAPPPQSYREMVLQAGGVLVRTQPLLLGFVAITLFVLYVTWQLAAEIRKTDRMQTQLLLERCLPKGSPDANLLETLPDQPQDVPPGSAEGGARGDKTL